MQVGKTSIKVIFSFLSILNIVNGQKKITLGDRDDTKLDVYLRSETCNDDVVTQQAEKIKCCCNGTSVPRIDRYCGTSLIVINGVDYSMRQRGLNVAVAVFNHKLNTWEEYDRRVFDTFGNSDAPGNFTEFYEDLPQSSVFFAVIQGSGGKYDPPELEDLGAGDWNLNVRESYAFIGGKIERPRPWFQEKRAAQGEGPAIISEVLVATESQTPTTTSPYVENQAPKVEEARKGVEGALGGLLGFSLLLLIIFVILCLKLKRENQNLHKRMESIYKDNDHVNKKVPIDNKITPPKRPEHPYKMSDDYVDPNNQNYILPKTYPSYHSKHENYVVPSPKNGTIRPRPTSEKPLSGERKKSQGEDYLTLTGSDYQESPENIYGEIPDNTYGEIN